MANNLKDLRTLTTFIRNFFSKAVLTIRGKVSVENLPEVQKVEVLNPIKPKEAVEVSNLSELQKVVETSLADVVKSVKAQTKDLKPEKVKKDLVSALTAIKKEVSVKPTDRTDDITSKLDEVVKSISKIDTTIDLSPVVKSVESLQGMLNILDDVKKFGRLKVELPEKQLEKLAGSFNAVVSGGANPSSALTAKRVDSGGSDASDDSTDKLYTAEYSGESGQKVHIVGDGDKYVISNANEGATVETADAIPIAAEDSSGNKQNLQLDTDKYLFVTPKDFLIEVQKGNITGHSMVHKFGRNPAVSTGGTYEHVSMTPFATANFRQSAIAMRVKAGNAADDASGAGAREITIQGIDSNFAETTASVATAGESASSNFSGTWWRIHRAWVSAAGAYTGANTGAVVIEDSGGSNDFITIAAGEGQSQYAGYTIPTGKTGYLLSVHVSVSVGTNKECNVRCFTRDNIDDVSAPMDSKRLKLFWDGIQEPFTYRPQGPELSISQKSDIWFEATATAESQISIDFELLLVDN